MPPAVYTQNIIAMIWDFDKTLTHGYMQDPLFARYNVDAARFWDEVNSLEKYYQSVGDYRIGRDTIYLNHILTYIRDGIFENLTSKILRELGSDIVLAPGLPDFFERIRASVDVEPYRRHEVKIEHYIVSTGLRAMIQGSALASHVNGIWACDLLPAARTVAVDGLPSQEELWLDGAAPDVLRQVGYVIDNTSKTRAIFEINKGVNVNPQVDVNSKISEDQRRVPFRNMIYIADGPSDIPSFSVVNGKGGKTLGVHAPGRENFGNAYSLQEQGRVNSIALADYTKDSAADMWLSHAVGEIANEIVSSREKALGSYGSVPNHIT
ncbi:haloacid dehalogenase-like hydrolase [Acidipropionibacterium jensenii]|uniref:haloacid dehalogenase-like hydrolase n=1 Tax=Acidipropionibacterium jensenii TaxID=1749 RepID=UPI000BC36234|nr:haloacid dehalogenase-like hydrolase [Acidipropionibacterium jensenii]AZZ42957.1 haloacid dehalogenase-like hydrolase [Acidipropionibacterium jensenii]